MRWANHIGYLSNKISYLNKERGTSLTARNAIAQKLISAPATFIHTDFNLMIAFINQMKILQLENELLRIISADRAKHFSAA
jgi:hypothetical protein